MHFDVDLLQDTIQITAHPTGGDERAHYREKILRDSHRKFCGMSMDEIADLSAFVTADDGTVISKSARTGVPVHTGELPPWVKS